MLAAVLVPAAARAAGGGGVFHSYHTDDWTLPSSGRSLELGGGFGYGVSGHEVHGGFGGGWTDEDRPEGTSGGMGGVIYGWRDHVGPVNFLLTSWTGIGGVQVRDASTGEEEQGYLLLSEEIDLEIGFAVLPWFMPSVYAGYQVAGNLAPGRPFSDWFHYTPVIGFRLTFGNFTR